MDVIIVESPNKIKKVREISGANVFATVGHFQDLPSDMLGVDPQTYDPIFVINPDKKNNIEKIIEACSGNKVFIASDADREGYAIGTMIYDQIKDVAGECWRLELREITKKGLADAFAVAKRWEDTNHRFYDSFLGRRVADRLVGYILSPIASSKLKGKFSVGRVQSPAVKLVVDREREIRNFKPSLFYTVSAQLKHNDITFTADFSGYPENDSFSSRESAMKAIGDASLAKYATVESVENKVVNRGPKAPFTTVDLQAGASISLSLSPEKTMQLAQGLYEAGLITYHRTDTVRLSDEFIAEAADFVKSTFGDEFIPEKLKKFSSNSQADAHEAIRPTHLHPITEVDSVFKETNLTEDHKKLYMLIFKRAVASTMADATFDSTVYKFSIGNLPFKASGSVPKFIGWQALYIEDTEDESEEKEQCLPTLSQGETIEKLSLDIDEKKTKAPARYTEASLVKQLEKLGIGRPSTYASIIGRVKMAGYMEIVKKKLKATTSGESLIDFLIEDYEWVIDYSLTANMENTLDLVADGQADWKEFVKTIHSRMNFMIPEQREPREIKPPTESQLDLANTIATRKEITIPEAALNDSREMAKFLEKHLPKSEPGGTCQCSGAIKEWEKSFQCQSCKTTIWKEFMGKKITKTQAVNLLNGKKIELKGLYSKQKEKEFDAKAELSEGKIKLSFGRK